MLPLESRATAHRKVTEGSNSSATLGASVSLPSLETERRVSVPFSKSAISDCDQYFVSTAHRDTAAHKTTMTIRKEDIESCNYLLLFNDNPQRVAAADH